MFISKSAFSVVPGLGGFTSIYVDPHLPEVSPSQIFEYCKSQNINAGGCSIIEAIRYAHYGEEYKEFLSKIKSMIDISPDFIPRHYTPDGVNNMHVDAVIFAESKIEKISDFIADFKAAEAYYHNVIVDEYYWNHDHVDSCVFEHYEKNKQKKNYLIEDAFIEVIKSYMKRNDEMYID